MYIRGLIAAVVVLCGLAGFAAPTYQEFRRELRAFYPDECHGDCKDPRQTNSVAAIGRELDAWAAALAKCPADDPLGRKELETALVGLDTIHEIQLKFAAEAKGRLKDGGAPGGRPLPANERHNLERIADAAGRCPWEPPRTFFEGLNTLWFVREVLGYLDGTDQFSLGRPDCYFIDLYRKDLALDAQKHPERHQNLIVRVCGFPARFVALSKRWQDEVIERHRLK